MSRLVDERYKILLRDWENGAVQSFNQFCWARHIDRDAFLDWIADEKVRIAKYVEVKQTKESEMMER